MQQPLPQPQPQPVLLALPKPLPQKKKRIRIIIMQLQSPLKIFEIPVLPQPLPQPPHENKSKRMIIHEQLFPPLLRSLHPHPQFAADNSLMIKPPE